MLLFSVSTVRDVLEGFSTEQVTFTAILLFSSFILLFGFIGVWLLKKILGQDRQIRKLQRSVGRLKTFLGDAVSNGDPATLRASVFRSLLEGMSLDGDLRERALAAATRAVAELDTDELAKQLKPLIIERVLALATEISDNDNDEGDEDCDSGPIDKAAERVFMLVVDRALELLKKELPDELMAAANLALCGKVLESLRSGDDTDLTNAATRLLLSVLQRQVKPLLEDAELVRESEVALRHATQRIFRTPHSPPIQEVATEIVQRAVWGRFNQMSQG